MKIGILWFQGQRPQFNIELLGRDNEPFVTIRGCRIVSGKDGDFVSYPAQKNETSGKWWNHVTGSDRFNAEILKLAREEAPSKPPSKLARGDDDIPF